VGAVGGSAGWVAAPGFAGLDEGVDCAERALAIARAATVANRVGSAVSIE
jgi:hypothetical protein